MQRPLGKPHPKNPPKGTKETQPISLNLSSLTVLHPYWLWYSYNLRHNSSMGHANLLLLLCGIFFCWYSHVLCPLASLELWSNVIFIVSSFMTILFKFVFTDIICISCFQLFSSIPHISVWCILHFIGIYTFVVLILKLDYKLQYEQESLSFP